MIRGFTVAPNENLAKRFIVVIQPMNIEILYELLLTDPHPGMFKPIVQYNFSSQPLTFKSQD